MLNYFDRTNPAPDDSDYQRSDIRPVVQGRGDLGDASDSRSEWQLLGGLTLSRSRQDNQSLGNSTTQANVLPDALINSSGPISTDVPVQFKLTGTYSVPVRHPVRRELQVAERDAFQPAAERADHNRRRDDDQRRAAEQ